MTVSSLAMAIGATLNGKLYDISGYLSVFYIMIVLNIICLLQFSNWKETKSSK